MPKFLVRGTCYYRAQFSVEVEAEDEDDAESRVLNMDDDALVDTYQLELEEAQVDEVDKVRTREGDTL